MNSEQYIENEVDILHMRNCITMSDIIITIGISGSGKSHITKKICSKFKFRDINIDKYRKNIAGDINNLSQDELIFEIAYNDMINGLKDGDKIIWSNTSCNLKYLDSMLIDIRNDITSDISISLLFLEDSSDIDICRKRIKDDMMNKKERANVSREILIKQNNGYNTVKNMFIEVSENNLSEKHQLNTYSIHTDQFDKIFKNI